MATKKTTMTGYQRSIKINSRLLLSCVSVIMNSRLSNYKWSAGKYMSLTRYNNPHQDAVTATQANGMRAGFKLKAAL